MNKTAIAIFSAMLFIVAGSIAYAMTGDEILAKVEASLTGPKDYECLSTMILANKDGSKREERSLKIWAAGKEKQIIKFVTPASVNGISLLNEGADEMYLYLPAQNKIRRIEGGSKNDDFQGTDFSYNEMGSYEYKNDYSAELTGETDTAYTLLLTKKPQATRAYEKLVMTVDKPDFIPGRIELYQNNVLKKILTISEVKKSGTYIIPVRIKMENVSKSHYTEIVMSDVKFDQDLVKNDIFSKRFLKKKP
jgi:outer membrane lipoprotein-sorting protein